MSPKEFFDKYGNWAVGSMARSGIPASIILAQAALESNYGESKLAKIANNFFGVKHHGWYGPYVLADDDEPNEKFRKYETAYDSFIDHSDFIMDQPRYNSLFENTDYKSWAYGLKQAGYATDPKYAEKLIKIIEDNNLVIYDREGDIQMKTLPNTIIRNRRRLYAISAIILFLLIVVYFSGRKIFR